MSTWVDAMDQPLWDYGPDGDLVEPNDVPGGSGVSGPIGMPDGALMASETTGDASAMALRARAAMAALELFGFNPHQRRDSRGRWVKMPDSELKRPRAKRRTQAAGGDGGYDARSAALASAARTGVVGQQELSHGRMGQTSIATFADGTTAVHKRTRGEYLPRIGPVWTPEDQADAEELTSRLADALGVRAPAIHRTGPTEMYMELMPGQTGMDAKLGRTPRRDRVHASKAALKMGLLDVLSNNPDRHYGNWLIDDDDNLYAIDHGLAFSSQSNPGFTEAGNGAFSYSYVNSVGGYEPENPLTPGDVQHVERVLEGMREQFAAKGREAWIDGALGRLRDLAERAAGTEPIYDERAVVAAEQLFGFNPHQLRGPDGRWVKMPTALRKERRRERDRQRREEKRAEREAAGRDAAADAVEQPAAAPRGQAAYREARDRFNLEMIDAVQHQINENEFDGIEDSDLSADLGELKRHLVRGDDGMADAVANALHDRMRQHYADTEVPDIPDEALYDPEVAKQRALREALDSYNAEIYQLGREWYDTLSDPREDPDTWGMDAVQMEQVVEILGERVARLGAAIEDGVPAAADRAAAAIRKLLVDRMLQLEHDFSRLPVAADFEHMGKVQGRLSPERKGNPLLASNSSYAERLAALERAVDEGVWGEDPLGQGAMGETKRLLLNDGTQVIKKRAKGNWPVGGEDWTPRQQTDAEELAALVGGVFGVRAPAVQRVDDTTINMEFVPDAVPAYHRFYVPDKVETLEIPGDVMGSDDALKLGLMDTLIGNSDRHGFNWLVDGDNNIYPIDHGLSFTNRRGAGGSEAGNSPFAREYFLTPNGNFMENILSRRDVEWAYQQLERVRPDFERAGRSDWHDLMQARLHQIGQRARGGNQHQLPAPQKETA